MEIEPDGPADGVRRGRREPQAGQRVIHADHDAFGGIGQREVEVEEDGTGSRDGAVKVGTFRHSRVGHLELSSGRQSTPFLLRHRPIAVSPTDEYALQSSRTRARNSSGVSQSTIAAATQAIDPGQVFPR